MRRATRLRRTLAALAAAALFIVLGLVAGRTGEARTVVPKGQSGPHSWPMFGGTNQRNLVNTLERNLPTTWSVVKNKQRNIKWVAQLGSRCYGSPVIAGGRVFLGTNNEFQRNPQIKGDKGILLCLSEADGSFQWQAVHEKLPTGMVNDWPREGVASTPVVEGNRLYYVSNRCELICADTEGFQDGSNDGVQDEEHQGPGNVDIIWRLDMRKEQGVFPHNLAVCSPLIADDLVFVVTGNGVDEEHLRVPVPHAPSFLAADKKTGKVVWQNSSPSARSPIIMPGEHIKAFNDRQRDAQSRGDTILHGQWSNPAYCVIRGRPQVIFPGGDGWIYAFEPRTGHLIWKFDCNPKSAKYILGGRGTRNELVGTPVVFADRCYIGVGQDPEHGEGVGHLWCIDATRTGDLSPELVTNPRRDPVETTANPNSGAIWHYGGPSKKEPFDRDFRFGRTMSTCAIHDGLLYIAELGGYLHCLDARTGARYWVEDLKGSIWGSPFCVDGKVYLGNEDGDLFVYAHGKRPVRLSMIEMERGIKGTPVAVNGVLYIATEGFLYAIQQN